MGPGLSRAPDRSSSAGTKTTAGGLALNGSGALSIAILRFYYFTGHEHHASTIIVPIHRSSSTCKVAFHLLFSLCVRAASTPGVSGSAQPSPNKAKRNGKEDKVAEIGLNDKDEYDLLDEDDELEEDDLDGKILSFVKLKLARTLFTIIVKATSNGNNTSTGAKSNTGEASNNSSGNNNSSSSSSSNNNSINSNDNSCNQSFEESIQILNRCYYLLLYDIYYCRIRLNGGVNNNNNACAARCAEDLGLDDLIPFMFSCADRGDENNAEAMDIDQSDTTNQANNAAAEAAAAFAAAVANVGKERRR